MSPYYQTIKAIPGFPTYFADYAGNIWQGQPGTEECRKLKPRSDGRGYLCVDVVDALKRRRTMKVHRLVYLAYHGDISDDCHIDHIDKSTINNRPSNLRSRCARENSRDCRKTSRKGCRPLTDEQKHAMAHLLLGGMGTAAVARVLHVGETTVRRYKKRLLL